MRKEVKLGFAIGGVLLSVLIVYVLVITGGSDKPDPVTLATSDNDKAAAEAPKPAEAKPADPKPDQGQTDPFKTDKPADAVAAAGDEKKVDSNEKWADGVLETGLPTMLSSSGPKLPDAAPITPAAPERTTPEHGSAPDAAISNAPAAITPPPGPTTRQGQSRITTPGTHIVQSGETFYTIAAAVYGNSSYFAHIVRANPNVDPRRLRPGMVINLPAVSDVKADGPAQTASLGSANIDSKTQYRVQEGDNLFRISQKLYGKSERADQLYDLNRSVIGSDPSKIRVGMVLKLPEPPSVKVQ